MRASTLITRLRQLGDAEIAAHSQRYFKTGPGEYGAGDRFLGIRMPPLRAEVKRHRDMPLAETLKLLRSPFHEARLFALLQMVDRFRRGDEATRKALYGEYLGHTDKINNWDLVDSSAPHIVGAHLLERERSVLYRLVASESLWERRIGIMACFTFIRENDYRDALALCEAVLEDPADLIHKAAGWMLREIGNRNRAVERAFLDRHGLVMPRTMLRYAIEKFPQRERKHYLERKR